MLKGLKSFELNCHCRSVTSMVVVLCTSSLKPQDSQLNLIFPVLDPGQVPELLKVGGDLGGAAGRVRGGGGTGRGEESE